MHTVVSLLSLQGVNLQNEVNSLSLQHDTNSRQAGTSAAE
jgi:hypothetical protein